MWEFFIKHSRFAYLFLAALIAVGGYSIATIPRESAPEVVVPVGMVTTVLPGAPAADVESLITNEFERGLKGLKNVKKVTSVSRESVSSVTVEFDASADVDESIAELKDQVDIIKQDLPSEAEEPSVAKFDFTNQPIMTIAVAGDVDDATFTRLSTALTDEIESISGISRVTTAGVRKREVTIIVDQPALIRYDLTLNELIGGVRNANISLPIGQIKNDGIAYNVAFEGDIADSSQIENVGIATRGGQPVYVRDVARVVDGLAPATSLSRLSQDGEPSKHSITLYVYKQSGGDITRITKAVNDRIDELKQPNELLDGLESVTVLDAGKDIKTDLVRLSSSGLQTVLLVVLLLVITLGWREGILAGSAIPLSFLFGFIGLYFSGNTINFLSLFSLILGIGILVDSAIVMVEGINRKMKDHPTIDKRGAAVATIREYSSALISGTLTTVAMFVGLFIVSGVIGQFIKSIPFTLIFILFASMFVSLAIIPLFASFFLKRRSATKFEQQQVHYAHLLESWYKRKLDAILGYPQREKRFMWGIRIALFIALLMPVFGIVKVVFFEQSDVDYVIVEVEQPEGTTKEITDIGVRRIEEALYQQPAIQSFVVTVGSGNEFGSGGVGEKLGNIFITLRKDRDLTSTEFVTQLQRELNDIRDFKIIVTQPSDGPPTGAAIVIKFLGDDLEELTRIANETAEIFKSVESVVNVETSTNNNNTEFVLTLDRAKVASYGLDAFQISQFARTAVFGTDVTSLTTLDEDIDVVVKLNADPTTHPDSDTTNVASIDDIARIMVPSTAGPVPLSDLVSVTLRESSAIINHEEGQRVVTVTADVTAEGNARDAQAAVLARVQNELSLPDSITISTGGGETEESNKAFMEMFIALIVGILLMVGILTLQFNSYLHMRYVLSILPYSLIGIMVGLAVTGNPLSFPSLMGFIALSGIVVNNSILLIDMMNQMRVEHPNKPIREIVLAASGNRLRPILLTTLTTVIGMIPLTYAGDLWAPLAYAVMFGLVFSVIITLVMIPIVYNRKPGALPE